VHFLIAKMPVNNPIQVFDDKQVRTALNPNRRSGSSPSSMSSVISRQRPPAQVL
jgi:hypothetical protein